MESGLIKTPDDGHTQTVLESLRYGSSFQLWCFLTLVCRDWVCAMSQLLIIM